MKDCIIGHTVRLKVKVLRQKSSVEKSQKAVTTSPLVTYRFAVISTTSPLQPLAALGSCCLRCRLWKEANQGPVDE